MWIVSIFIEKHRLPLMGHASKGGGKAPAFSLTGNFDMNGISEPKLLWYMCRKFSWLSFDTKYGEF